VRGSVQSSAGFQLRVALRDVLPPIWRRFVVPGAIALPGLHRVIQEVMGWENYHLHIFRFGEKEYGIPDPDYPDIPTEMRNEKGRRLREFLRDEGVLFGYEYDFICHGVAGEHILTFPINLLNCKPCISKEQVILVWWVFWRAGRL
jgi:hypothetical protein